MALPSFDELYKIDVSALAKKYNGFDYVPWLDCLLELRKNGAEHISYDCNQIKWTKDGKFALVKVRVTIDGRTETITHPVADGETPIAFPSSVQIAWSIQRAFVKCVAINWGFGLSLWKGESMESSPAPKDQSLAIKIPIEFGKLVNVYGSADEVHKKIGTNKQEVARVIAEGTDEERQALLNKILSLDQPF